MKSTQREFLQNQSGYKNPKKKQSNIEVKSMLSSNLSRGGIDNSSAALKSSNKTELSRLLKQKAR